MLLDERIVVGVLPLDEPPLPFNDDKGGGELVSVEAINGRERLS